MDTKRLPMARQNQSAHCTRSGAGRYRTAHIPTGEELCRRWSEFEVKSRHSNRAKTASGIRASKARRQDVSIDSASEGRINEA